MHRPKTWRSVFFIYLLQHHDFLTFSTGWFSIYFFVAWSWQWKRFIWLQPTYSSLCTNHIWGNWLNLKARANEDKLIVADTLLLPTQMFPRCPRVQHLLRTQILCPGHKKCFRFCSETFCVRNKCFPVCAAQETSWATMRCPQQCVLVYQGL